MLKEMAKSANLTESGLVRKAIDQAKETLINDRHLNFILNSTGSVRVAVLLDPPATYSGYEPLKNLGVPFVTFTIEDGCFGKRLFAEFEGRKEFAA